MLAESVPPEKSGSSVWAAAVDGFRSAIAGPLLALCILRAHDVRTVFWMAAIPGA